MTNIKTIAGFIKEKLPDGGMICITGAGASGKTVLARKLADELGRDNSGHFEFDCFYIPDFLRREMKDSCGETITGCHPSSINRELATKTIISIKKCADTETYFPAVENGKATFKISGFYKCKKYNLIDGLASPHAGAELYDMIIFIECAPEVERKRRFQRDIMERKKPAKDVEKIFEIRRKQYKKYILPFKKKACLILKSLENYELEIIQKKYSTSATD
jgi:uridine kinase